MLLSCTGLSLQRNGKKLVDAVSLDLGAGELVGLIGPNGAGKSTLLDLLANIVAADEGDVFLKGNVLRHVDPADRSRLLCWVGQSGPINWPISVERLVSLGRRPHLGSWQQPGVDDQAAIEQALEATDTQSLRHQDATTLSGGERSRVLLARALATAPEVLLADEPIASLDLGHQLQTMDVLRVFATGERASLVVMHDLSLAARFCDRLYLMNQGRIIASGRPAEVLTVENIRGVYGVDVAIGEHQQNQTGRMSWFLPINRI